MQNLGWEKGCIPESPDSFIENLVQRVDRGRFRFEVGDTSNGPGLMDSQNLNPNSSLNQADQETGIGNIGPNDRDLGPFEQLTLGLGPSTTLTARTPLSQRPALQCDEDCGDITEEVAPKPFTKKRLGKEIGKIGRNIKQRLWCVVSDKETEHDQVIDEQEETMDTDMHQGHREAGLQQLPQQP